jgi:hypothetical protein
MYLLYLFMVYLTTLTLSTLYNFDDRMINECGVVGETGICRVTRVLGKKSTPVPFYPPQIPHNVIWH